MNGVIINFLRENARGEDVRLEWEGKPIGTTPVTMTGTFLWNAKEGCHVETSAERMSEMLGSQEAFDYDRALRLLTLPKQAS